MIFKKICVPFINSFKGIFRALKEEFSFRVEFLLSLLLISISFFIGNNTLVVILLAGCTLLILIVELLNTAVETTLNRISSEKNDLTKYAKDLGSGAVLISLLLWLITWSLIVIY